MGVLNCSFIGMGSLDSRKVSFGDALIVTNFFLSVDISYYRYPVVPLVLITQGNVGNLLTYPSHVTFSDAQAS